MKAGCTGPPAMRNDRRRLERDDEGQEIERERHHPEQRHGGDIGRMCAVTAINSPDGTAASADPGRDVAPARPRRRRSSRATVRGRAASASDSTPQPPISTIRPKNPTVQSEVWCAEPDERLDHERIGEQREEAADIARGVEKIRILGRADDRCARTTPAAAAHWRRAQRTAARSTPRTVRSARVLRPPPADVPIRAAICSGSASAGRDHDGDMNDGDTRGGAKRVSRWA